MYRSNLDVWTIQKHPEQLENALANIKNNSTNNLIYTNCLSSLKLNDNEIMAGRFDTVLYSEDSGTMIMLMKNCGVDFNDVKKYLNDNKIMYDRIDFNDEEDYDNSNLLPELLFAEEEYVLKDALKETKNKYNVNDAIYYPNVNLDLSLFSIINEQQYPFDEININGVVEVCDKLILLIQHGDKRNLKYNQVVDTLYEMGFDYEIDEYNIPKSIEKAIKTDEKTFVKK